MLLSEEQKKVVDQLEGNILINAWAGSGKTHTITARIVNLIETKTVFPFQIMAMTFTNKAAREMKERILEALKKNENINFRTPPLIGTFHSIALKFLKTYYDRIGYYANFTILDANDSTKILKEIYKKYKKELENYEIEYIDFIDFISTVKSAWYSPTALKKHLEEKAEKLDIDVNDEYGGQLCKIKMYREYQYQLMKMNSMDFDDILINFRNILQMKDVIEKITSEYKYFFVDEFQDTNIIQCDIIKMLSSANNNLCVIWDDYQSIYSFRNAKLANILGFHNNFHEVKTFNLWMNYRSTNNIVKGAAGLISYNQKQLHKDLNSSKEDGSKIELVEQFNDYAEAQYIASTIKNRFNKNYKQNLILVRNTSLTQPLETVFLRDGIPYKIIGWTSFFERVEIKDVKSILEFAVNPYSELAFYRMVDLFVDGVWRKTAEKIINHYASLSMSYDNMFRNPEHLLEEKVISKSVLEKIKKVSDKIVELPNCINGVNILSDIKKIIEHMDYLSVLQMKCNSSEEFEDRRQNVNQLLNIASDYFERGENDVLTFLESITIDAEEKTEQELSENFVSIMTIHRSKWLEFDNVFVFWVNEGIIPSKKAETPEELEEERRLLYVAMTRAKENLFLTYAKKRRIYGLEEYFKPSPFLKEIDKNYCILVKN